MHCVLDAVGEEDASGVSEAAVLFEFAAVHPVNDRGNEQHGK